MKTFRTILVFIFAALLVVNLFFIDYHDLFSRKNLSGGLNLVVAICGITSMVLSNRYDDKHPES